MTRKETDQAWSDLVSSDEFLRWVAKEEPKFDSKSVIRQDSELIFEAEELNSKFLIGLNKIYRNGGTPQRFVLTREDIAKLAYSFPIVRC